MPYRRSVRREDERKKGSETGGGRDMGIQARGREEIPGRVFSTVGPGEKNPDARLTAMREKDRRKAAENKEKEQERRKKSY